VRKDSQAILENVVEMLANIRIQGRPKSKTPTAASGVVGQKVGEEKVAIFRQTAATFRQRRCEYSKFQCCV